MNNPADIAIGIFTLTLFALGWVGGYLWGRFERWSLQEQVKTYKGTSNYWYEMARENNALLCRLVVSRQQTDKGVKNE